MAHFIVIILFLNILFLRYVKFSFYGLFKQIKHKVQEIRVTSRNRIFLDDNETIDLSKSPSHLFFKDNKNNINLLF